MRRRLGPATAAAAAAATAIALALGVALAARTGAAPERAPDLDPDRAALEFPRAWGAHPNAALEWWYVTAVVRDDDGRAHGIQWTFFRVRAGEGDEALPGARPHAPPSGARSAWRAGELYFAHVAHGDSVSHAFGVAERIGRSGPALAGADTTDLHVWLGDWSLRREPDGRFRLRGGDGETIELVLTPSRPRPVAWGPAYRSAKSPDPRYYSRYQSDPAMAAAGTIRRAGGGARAVRGTAWFDHEWSDGAMDPAVVGWDWLGARLGDGRAVMLYRLRDAAGGARHFFGGIVGRDGRVTPLGAGQARMNPLRYWKSPRSGARYPTAWRISLEPPGAPRLTLDFEAAFDAQELTTDRSTRVTYWEGMVGGTAEQGGARTRLEGYLEMTGYAGGGVPGRISSAGPRGR